MQKRAYVNPDRCDPARPDEQRATIRVSFAGADDPQSEDGGYSLAFPNAPVLPPELFEGLRGAIMDVLARARLPEPVAAETAEEAGETLYRLMLARFLASRARIL